ncbi:hypothetical protein AYO20_11730 [Fonsecaea nubica]|uniref:Uncharacterized protein n=1 Tax=Fonsecaea nubica TaxID=856822 RepID=A0A178BMP8_9EURO|nr:hypothetical protein AYO20_11730 [Fonsecaea nubica]OAL18637.1 hypothetical protein AYO20_11730 [Fonsecaea nubica]
MIKTMLILFMDVEGPASDPKRRKATSGSNERYLEVNRWVQVPAAVAERMPEPKYLAGRRRGMESLYKGAYKAANGFGSLADIVAPAMSNGTTGYDLSDINPASALARGDISVLPLAATGDRCHCEGNALPGVPAIEYAQDSCPTSVPSL